MSTQFELRTTITNELAAALDDYFLENELINWGIRQKELNDPYEVFGIFPDTHSGHTALSELRNTFPELPEKFTEKIIEDADWQNAYKEFLKPWSDRRLHWIPLWERDTYAAPENAIRVYLDSGMAFGTGAHETTRLCARRLVDYYETHNDQLNKSQVIDAGCGSGILALSAAALGFKNVSGFDIDPEAIGVCLSNAGENPHIATPEFSTADLENGLKNKQADLLLANIQTDVLIPFSLQLVQSIHPSGTLVLSGILTKEVEVVRTHYTAEFVKLRPEETFDVDSRQDGEWSDLQFQLSAR
ncbi:MAG: ribosomal protein L11 methyltransferase [Lentimonas sp.]|jgi:ribosomal protein L11 methyltransferase